MELEGTVWTAQDLFELLCQIPEGVRDRLPVEVLFNDGMDMLEAPFKVSAYEGTETQGNIERSFRLSPEKD